MIPAFGRYQVSRLAFAGIAWLTSVLAGRGITAHTVVVADDGNLELADEHGFDTIRMPNTLGARVNAGFEWLAEKGADWFCFTGSDNWLHPDLFDGLAGPAVVAGRHEAIVDLEQGRMTVIRVSANGGTPPWLIPRALLEPCGFRPLPDWRTRGLELSLVIGLGMPEFAYRDPNLVARVDFKSAVGITTYRGLAHLGGPGVDPWPVLGEVYPESLLGLAVETSEALRCQEVYA